MQRGRGLGAILSRVFGRLIPFLKSTGAKVLKSATSKATKKVAKKALKSAGKSALTAASNAALNAIEGKPVKEGVQKDLSSARKNLAKTIRSEISPPVKSGARVGQRGKKRAIPSIAKRKKTLKTLLD